MHDAVIVRAQDAAVAVRGMTGAFSVFAKVRPRLTWEPRHLFTGPAVSLRA